MSFQIEKDVPFAGTLGRGKVPKYPFADMEVGDSIALVDERQLKSARNAAFLFKQSRENFGPGHWDYGATKYKDGSGRLWRTA